MIQTNIFTPALAPQSRLIAELIACLREEAKSLEKRVAALLGNSLAKAAAGSSRRPRKGKSISKATIRHRGAMP